MTITMITRSGNFLYTKRCLAQRVRVQCMSLLLMKSLSIASQFDLSSAVVSQVMSLVRSLLYLLDLSGCK